MKEQRDHSTGDSCCCEPGSGNEERGRSSFFKREWLPSILSAVLLVAGLTAQFILRLAFFDHFLQLLWYVLAYIPVGVPVLLKAWKHLRTGDVFTEYFLMSLATFGAFYIGHYGEGVAVMLFYAVGEHFQSHAVNRSRRNIRELLDLRPDKARIREDGTFRETDPSIVPPGAVIYVKAGERIPLDGRLLNERVSLDTSALTGESEPSEYEKGREVLAGMIVLDDFAEIEVSKPFSESSISRMLELVEQAAGKKAKTESFIRHFARVYTPAVTYLAIALVLIPWFFVDAYNFHDWLYRGLIFLVISCPCALVISIPLGYFGGIGAASRNGILFKGSHFLDLITKVETVVFDKTGTLTEGVFRVHGLLPHENHTETSLLEYAATLGSHSGHPASSAIAEYGKEKNVILREISRVRETRGKGVSGEIGGREVAMGKISFLREKGVEVENGEDESTAGRSLVHVAAAGNYCGKIVLGDRLKEDSRLAIGDLRKGGVKRIIVLSGDRREVVREVAKELDLDEAYGELLPEQKLDKIEELKRKYPGILAFAGDGINDAPALARADIGIAMGGLGSDAAIETADVVIQTDRPSRIATAIKTGRLTRSTVWQNIVLALGIKAVVLSLGALGLASLWAAVFADVGVALLAILNAARLHLKKF